MEIQGFLLCCFSRKLVHKELLPKWFATVELFVCWILFSMELLFTVTAHSLTLRFCMCHTLILGLFAVETVWLRAFSYRWQRWQILWGTICYTAMMALCVVNFIHALRMLLHRHDSGIHHAYYILALSVIDFIVKTCLFFFKSESYLISPAGALVFLLLPAFPSLITTALRVYFGKGNVFILWLDPSFTLIESLIVFVLALKPMTKLLPILLLAVPKNTNVQLLKDSFHSKFVDAEIHHFHLWSESLNEVKATAHIRHRMPLNEGQLVLADEYMVNFVRLKTSATHVSLQHEIFTNNCQNVSINCCTKTCEEKWCCPDDN